MRDLTQGSIHKNFLIFSIPIIISSVLSSAFGIINTAIAGHFLGTVGLAATSATANYFTIIYALFYGLAFGMSISVGNLFGAKEYKRLKDIIVTCQIAVVVLTLIIGFISLFLYRPIFSFLKVEADIYEDSLSYYRCLCIHLCFAMLNHFFLMTSHAIGETKLPLYLSVISSVLSIAANWLTVGILHLGILGICINVLWINPLITVLYCIRFHFFFKEMGADKHRVIPRLKYIKSLLPSAVPNAFQQTSMYLAGFLISPLRNAMGHEIMAAVSVSGQIGNLCNTVYYASAKTSANYIAQSVGAKKYHNIRKAVGVAFIQGCLFFLPILFFILLFPDLICGMFIDQADNPETWEYLKTYIYRFLPFIACNMVAGIFHSVFRGIKSNRYLVVSSCICSLAKLIVSYATASSLGIIGLYCGTVAGWVCEAVYVLIIFFTGLWVPKKIRPLVLPKKEKKKALQAS